MPRSMWLFERAVWAALAIDFAANLATWPRLGAGLAARGLDPSPLLMLGICAGSPAIGLLLWYMIARRRSTVAKWLLVTLVAIALAGFVFSLSRPLAAGSGVILACGAAAAILKIFAASRLFAADAVAWLSRGEHA